MRPLLALVLTSVALLPASARAESCEEVHQSCLESCSIDFGMEKERVKLAGCVKRCDTRERECAEVRHEERRSNVRLGEVPPETRQAPVDVRPYHEDEAPGDVRPAELEYEEPSERKEGYRPAPEAPEQAPLEERPSAQDEPAAEPQVEEPAVRPAPSQGEDERPRRRDKDSDPGSDDWAR